MIYDFFEFMQGEGNINLSENGRMEEKKRDVVIFEDKWMFNDEVTACFPDMLRRSIPQYDAMRGTVNRLSREFVRTGTQVVDLGCSRGDALAPLVREFQDSNHYIGIDVSAPMLKAARKRFRYWDFVRIEKMDLREAYPEGEASVTLSVLTIQFVPIEYRQQIIQRAFDNTQKGGAFILVEKILGNTAPIDTLMVGHYLAMKSDNGYTQEQIERKRLALEGVLVPVTSKWNEEMLLSAGFRCVDCFWRWMNFAGWVAIK